MKRLNHSLALLFRKTLRIQVLCFEYSVDIQTCKPYLKSQELYLVRNQSSVFALSVHSIQTEVGLDTRFMSSQLFSNRLKNTCPFSLSFGLLLYFSIGANCSAKCACRKLATTTVCISIRASPSPPY